MQDFEKIDRERQEVLAPYFAAQELHIGDFSLGFQFMWHKAPKTEYAVVGGCLVLRERYAGHVWFHYPLSLTGDREEELRAVAALEKICRDGEERLRFTNVPRSRAAELALRYPGCRLANSRRWRDYLYEAEDFRTYGGKKLAGQRNHANKFAKLYPSAEFRPAGADDLPAIVRFLDRFAKVQLGKNDRIAREELEEVYALLPHIGALGLMCGMLSVGGDVIGFSVGERCGDTVVVHIEKALREYEGVYPFLAREFARTFCGQVRYINRMDDAGDVGLRKSKLQYRPCELVDKFNVIPERAIDRVARLPEIASERLLLAPVGDENTMTYAVLASDRGRNRYWGWDYAKETGGKVPEPEWFLETARRDFARRMEMPLGVFADGKLVGEVVLHRFGYASEAELGVRLLPEAEGKGYASEAMRAYAAYAFGELGLERVEAKCFRENARSRAMLLRAGFLPDGEDSVFFRFYMTPET